MKKILIVLFAALCLLGSCGGVEPPQEETEVVTFRQISQEEAKTIMSTNREAVILDVRTQEEYDSGHIKGAVLLPVDAITEESAREVIPTKETQVLVYCRSGNRSVTASKALAQLGYTEVYEFGGINTWPYETETW
ncbi:MAG: rhodanese-like domain-containing protein [Ruminiclostridium sp.]|nr:rhodanese-like domain-containing protein [Ruminiclostridium sp.]MBQ9932407.1 rhodanese-like domain-containing protein [Ruminiclostridium sp.]